jgi:hypothetical protein
MQVRLLLLLSAFLEAGCIAPGLWLWQKEKMAKRGTTGKRGRVRILSRKTIPQAGLCILIENGVPCANPIYARGICQKHTSYLRAHNRLEEYAHPVNANGRKHLFMLKRNPEPGVCRVIVNGKPCLPRPRERC